MTHEPALISDARQAWVDQVAAMSPAEKDGAMQAILDAAYAFGLAVIPRERILTLSYQAEQPETMIKVMAVQELAAREALQAAHALAQLAFEKHATERTLERRLGKRVVRHRLTVILPKPEDAAVVHATLGTPL